MQAFGKIFPGVAGNTLNSLCAILVAGNYLVSLIGSHERTNYPYWEYSLPSIDASSSSSDGAHERSAAYGTRFVILLPQQARDRILWSRSVDIRKRLDEVFDKLLCGICGHSDERLKTTMFVLMEVLESRKSSP